MSLNKNIEKGAIFVVLLLVLVACLCNLDSLKNGNGMLHINDVLESGTPHPYDLIDMPKDIKQISKKYNAFREIYDSDELLLVYGYEPLSIEEKDNRIFHKDIDNLIKEHDLKVKVLSYKDWRDYIDKAQEDNGKDPNACTLFSAGEKDLQLIIETTQDCFRNACVVDAKNNKYVVIAKNPMNIVATIEKYLGKQN